MHGGPHGIGRRSIRGAERRPGERVSGRDDARRGHRYTVPPERRADTGDRIQEAVGHRDAQRVRTARLHGGVAWARVSLSPRRRALRCNDAYGGAELGNRDLEPAAPTLVPSRISVPARPCASVTAEANPPNCAASSADTLTTALFPDAGAIDVNRTVRPAESFPLVSRTSTMRAWAKVVRTESLCPPPATTRIGVRSAGWPGPVDDSPPPQPARPRPSKAQRRARRLEAGSRLIRSANGREFWRAEQYKRLQTNGERLDLSQAWAEAVTTIGHCVPFAPARHARLCGTP